MGANGRIVQETGHVLDEREEPAKTPEAKTILKAMGRLGRLKGFTTLFVIICDLWNDQRLCGAANFLLLRSGKS